MINDFFNITGEEGQLPPLPAVIELSDTFNDIFETVEVFTENILTKEQFEAAQLYALGSISFSQLAEVFNDILPMSVQIKIFNIACSYAEIYSAKYDMDMNKAEALYM